MRLADDHAEESVLAEASPVTWRVIHVAAKEASLSDHRDTTAYGAPVAWLGELKPWMAQAGSPEGRLSAGKRWLSLSAQWSILPATTWRRLDYVVRRVIINCVRDHLPPANAAAMTFDRVGHLLDGAAGGAEAPLAEWNRVVAPGCTSTDALTRDALIVLTLATTPGASAIRQAAARAVEFTTLASTRAHDTGAERSGDAASFAAGAAVVAATVAAGVAVAATGPIGIGAIWLAGKSGAGKWLEGAVGGIAGAAGDATKSLVKGDGTAALSAGHAAGVATADRITTGVIDAIEGEVLAASWR